MRALGVASERRRGGPLADTSEANQRRSPLRCSPTLWRPCPCGSLRRRQGSAAAAGPPGGCAPPDRLPPRPRDPPWIPASMVQQEQRASTERESTWTGRPWRPQETRWPVPRRPEACLRGWRPRPDQSRHPNEPARKPRALGRERGRGTGSGAAQGVKAVLAACSWGPFTAEASPCGGMPVQPSARQLRRGSSGPGDSERDVNEAPPSPSTTARGHSGQSHSPGQRTRPQPAAAACGESGQSSRARSRGR